MFIILFYSLEFFLLMSDKAEYNCREKWVSSSVFVNESNKKAGWEVSYHTSKQSRVLYILKLPGLVNHHGDVDPFGSLAAKSSKKQLRGRTIQT